MSNEIQFLLYNLPDKEGRVQVVIKDETIWCTQKAMAELFGIDKSGISRHIANIFREEELQQDTTVAKIATVVNRGIRGEVEELVDFYNLDMIIALLDFAESQAEKEQPMTMNDWANYLDRILTSTGEQLLLDGGRVSHQEAMDHATTEYRKYKQRTLSDVEQDYLNAIKAISDKSKKGGKK